MISIKNPDLKQFSDTDIEVLKKVYEVFWWIPTRNLVEITHKYPEWKKFEPRITSWALQVKMDYLDFFENIPNQDPVFDTSEEHLESAKGIFQEDSTFCRFFS